jgi:hypothetical protein
MALLPTISRGNKNRRIGGNVLSYPKELGTMKRHEHYVIFMINAQANSEIVFADGANANATTTNNEATTLSIKRAPTKRLSQAIALYMPSTISVSHKANYGEPEMGMAVAAVAGALGTINNETSLSEIAKKLGQDALKEGGEALGMAALDAADATFAPGAKSAYQISKGYVTNNRTEMAFEGIDRRDFSFSFKMLPTSSEEANTISEIVTAFRFHAMPEIEGDSLSGRTMIPPSTFDIEYKPNEFLHKISTSILTSVDVQYGGERTQFFTDDHPVETSITLNFKELEIITKERIAKGF